MSETIDSSSLAGFHSSPDPGCFELVGAVFENATFDRVSVGPGLPKDRHFRLKDCAFKRCKVFPGEFVFRGGVELIRVEFDTVESTDSLTISTNALLDSVVVKGRVVRGGLWVRPDEIFDIDHHRTRMEWVQSRSIAIETLLDFSQLESDNVEVIGLQLEKLRFDSSRHIAIRSESFGGVDWDKLGISRTGYFRGVLRRLRTFGSSVGVFARPRQQDQRFSTYQEELQLLNDAGFLNL